MITRRVHPAILSVAIVILGGCVERRIAISSEPSGALVWLNDIEVGRTPVEVDFTYFGTYDVQLRKEGWEPMITTAEAKAPLHEQPVIDLVAMLIPGWKRTRIDWHFDLERPPTDTAALIERADELRQRLEASRPDETAETPDGAGSH